MDTVFILCNTLLITMVAVAYIYHPKYKNSNLKLLPYFLTLSFLIEITAYILAHTHHYNIWLYNQYINIEYLFYIWLFYQYIENNLYKKLIIIFTFIYEVYFLISIIFLSDNINVMPTYAFAFAQILIIIVLFTFLLQMLSSDKILHIQQYLIFWVAVGLLFYYVVPLPLNVSENLLRKEMLSHKTLLFLRNIQFVGNVLMYLSIIYGLIWSSKTYTSP